MHGKVYMIKVQRQKKSIESATIEQQKKLNKEEACKTQEFLLKVPIFSKQIAVLADTRKRHNTSGSLVYFATKVMPNILFGLDLGQKCYDLRTMLINLRINL